MLMVSDSNFVRFFGKSPVILMIDALIDNIGSDYSKKEIQELAGLSKGALFKHWKTIESIGIVRVTRRYGKTKLYALNTDNPVVKDIMKWEIDMIQMKMPEKQGLVAGTRKRATASASRSV